MGAGWDRDLRRITKSRQNSPGPHYSHNHRSFACACPLTSRYGLPQGRWANVQRRSLTLLAHTTPTQTQNIISTTDTPPTAKSHLFFRMRLYHNSARHMHSNFCDTTHQQGPQRTTECYNMIQYLHRSNCKVLYRIVQKHSPLVCPCSHAETHIHTYIPMYVLQTSAVSPLVRQLEPRL